SQFQADCAAGTLPQVSWIWANAIDSDHPPAPPEYGEYTTDQILGALTGNPGLWAKTALVVTWDENGGFFDHVRPPTPPPGTPGGLAHDAVPGAEEQQAEAGKGEGTAAERAAAGARAGGWAAPQARPAGVNPDAVPVRPGSGGCGWGVRRGGLTNWINEAI